MSSAFDIQLAKTTYKTNLIICITIGTGDVYFTQHQVDGTNFRNVYDGYVLDATVNGESIDLRAAKSSIPTVNFSLLDKNNAVSGLIAQDSSAFMNSEVKLYLGFITGSFAFGNYKLMATTNITRVTKSANRYNFTSKAPTGLIQKRIYSTSTLLDGDINDSVTSIDLIDGSEFPASGTAIIGEEIITWSAKVGDDQLNPVVREVLGTAAAHDDKDEIHVVTVLEEESMDAALEVIINQAGVDSDLVDSDSFTDLRDGEFSGDGDFKFYMYDIENALTWLEKNILQPTNTRLVNIDGKITCVLLDQIAFSTDSESITEDHIIGDPSYSIDSDKIVNKIIVKYDYNWADSKFETVTTYTDSDSISAYGEKSALTIEMKGVTTGTNGSSFVENKVNKLFARLSTPQVIIGVKALFNRYNIAAGDKVYVEHRYLPNPGSGAAFNYMLEVLSTAPQGFKDNPYVNFSLAFTSFSNLSTGLISPSPLISSVTSQTVFTVPDGDLFEVGYMLKLWNDSTGAYYSDDAIAIESIDGDEITMASAFTTTLTTSVRITFPDFGDASSAQQIKYAWISPDTDKFATGKSAYQIIP